MDFKRRRIAHFTVAALIVGGMMPGATRATETSRAPAGVAGAASTRILVLGDSLSAEYGLARGTGWVALLQARLNTRGLHATVTNGSISGDTTAGGRTRLPQLLAREKPTIVVIELGGNDALRGLPLAASRANLEAMIAASKQAGARVIVAGMRMPPNYGQRYSDEFAAIFAQAAKAGGAALVPFLLHGIADAPQADALFQDDRIHPKAEAHPRILDNVWPVLAPMLPR